MLEDFRQQAKTSPFFEEEEHNPEVDKPEKNYFLGLSPAQRFLIALLLLFMTCLVGSFLLLVTDRVVLPFI